MTKFAVSFGNGNDGLSRLYPDYFVSCDFADAEILISKLAMLSRFTGHRRAWAAREMRDSECGDTAYSQTLDNPPGRGWSEHNGAWLICEVYPADEASDRSEAHHYETLDAAFGAAMVRYHAKGYSVAPVPAMVEQPAQQQQSNAGEMSDAERKAILIRESENPSRHPHARQAYREMADAIASDVPPAATVIRSAQSIRDGLDAALVARYSYFRMMRYDRTKRVAFAAICQARIDTKDRYPDQATGWQTGRGMERFIEKPADCGLRFVGYANEIVKLHHKGWFTDRDTQDSVMRGVVYQMPSRRGELLFVPGYNLSTDHYESAVLDFTSVQRETYGPQDNALDVKDFARDAAYYANSFAERAAEEECDYQEAWRAGSNYVDAGEQYRAARTKFIRETAAMRGTISASVLKQIREDITERFLAIREELMTKRHKLFSDYGNTDAFREHLPE